MGKPEKTEEKVEEKEQKPVTQNIQVHDSQMDVKLEFIIKQEDKKHGN